MLKNLQPTGQIFELAKVMFKDAWDMRLVEVHKSKDSIAKQIADLEKQIESLLDRIVDSSSPSIIKAYEGRIGKLEREGLLLREQAGKILPPKG